MADIPAKNKVNNQFLFLLTLTLPGGVEKRCSAFWPGSSVCAVSIWRRRSQCTSQLPLFEYFRGDYFRGDPLSQTQLRHDRHRRGHRPSDNGARGHHGIAASGVGAMPTFFRLVQQSPTEPIKTIQSRTSALLGIWACSSLR